MLGVFQKPSSHNNHGVLSKVSRPADSQQFLQLEKGGSFGPGMVFVPQELPFSISPPQKRSNPHIYTHTHTHYNEGTQTHLGGFRNP